MDLFLCLILIVLSLLFLYLYFILKEKHEFFKKRGIPYLLPSPIFGNAGEQLLFKTNAHFAFADFHKKLEPHRFGGFFFMYKPGYLIRDPQLIKHILVKDFSHFHDREMSIDEKAEPFAKGLFLMKGDEWKNLRIKLTPTFTSGKMKFMFPLMKNCAVKLNSVLGKTTGTFDVKDLCSRYTTDIIGTCAFGLEINSLENPDTEFRTMGNRIFQFRFRSIIRSFFPNLPTILVKIFDLRFFDSKVLNYFHKHILEMVKYREDNRITRYDFLDLLIALKNNSMKENFGDQDERDIEKFLKQVGERQYKNELDMTVELMTAQCVFFFGAGFETSSNVLSFLMYELSRNEDIQNKVREEIKMVLEKYNGELTYEGLKEMPYVDMVLAETMRLYPPTGILSRICTSDYQIPGTEIIIPKKSTIGISIIGLHRDGKYYEKPEEFYPEHFTKEEISKRPKFTYLPFGEGPRVCIAERFARMQIKTGLAQMIKDCSFKLAPTMKQPLEFKRGFTGLLQTEDAILLECEKL